MSNNSITPKGSNLTLVYGYDRPSSHYFFGIFDENYKEGEEPTEDTSEYYLPGCTKIDILLKKLKEFNAPKHHIEAVLLDLPIPQGNEPIKNDGLNEFKIKDLEEIQNIPKY